jgi:predicted nucleic acid-binding protein
VKGEIVTDSTCLIVLERISLLDILPQLFEQITIASAVAEEFGRSLPWLNVEIARDEESVAWLKRQLDSGEAETIVLARERTSRVLIDERRARAVAKRLGLSVIETVGVLLIAKRESIIPEVTPVLEHMKTNGFYMTEDLREYAIRLAGE